MIPIEDFWVIERGELLPSALFFDSVLTFRFSLIDVLLFKVREESILR